MSENHDYATDDADLQAANRRKVVNHSHAIDPDALLKAFRATRDDAYALSVEDMERDKK